MYCFCLSLAGHVPIIFFHPLTAISVLPDFSSTEQWLWGMEKVVFLLDLWRKERVNVLDLASLKKNNWIPLLNKGYVFIIQSNHVMRDTCKPEIWSWGNLLLPVSRLNVKIPYVVSMGLRTIFIWLWYTWFLIKCPRLQWELSTLNCHFLPFFIWLIDFWLAFHRSMQESHFFKCVHLGVILKNLDQDYI